jgi:hypothetical protein
MRFAGILLAVLWSCLLTVGVSASSFGLNPYKVDVQVEAGQSTEVVFTVSGFSGIVEVNVEDLPIKIDTESFEVFDGSRINLTIRCDADIAPKLYTGKLVFLTKSGDSGQSGIKIPCSLTVNRSSLADNSVDSLDSAEQVGVEQTLDVNRTIGFVGLWVLILVFAVIVYKAFRRTE